MRPIGPHEYDYLSYPYLSAGADMLEYALQHLCFTGALDLHYWKVAAHPKNPRPVVRLFLARGNASTPLSRAEAFALSLVPADRAIHLGELRIRMKELVKDEESFKFDLVRKDLKAAGLLRFTYWPSAEGREVRGHVSDLLTAFKRDLHELLAGPREALDLRLDELGSNVMMLGDAARDRLKEVDGRTPDLGAVISISTFLQTDGVHMDPGSLTGVSFGGGGGGGFGGGGGGFGGFGGGSFGGGGAGGSW